MQKLVSCVKVYMCIEQIAVSNPDLVMDTKIKFRYNFEAFLSISLVNVNMSTVFHEFVSIY